MKKIMVLVLILSLSIVSVNAREKDQKDDISKDFSFVEKVEAVPEKMKTGFDSISGNDAEAYLRFLASDSLQGRAAATPMYKVAAEFAAAMFRLWGVKPAGDVIAPVRRRFSRFVEQNDEKNEEKRSFFQEVKLKEITGRSSSVTLEFRRGASKKIRNLYPDMDYSLSFRENGELSGPVVFVGCGISEKSINFDEYKGIDVKGKILLMFNSIPRQGREDSPFNKGKLKEKYSPMRARRWRDPRIQVAEKKGAAAVILVENSPGKPGLLDRGLRSPRTDDENPIIPWSELPALSLIGVPRSSRWNRLPTIRLSREIADIMLTVTGDSVASLSEKIDRDLKPHSKPLPGVFITAANEVEVKLTHCCNVLGLVEGSDPELKHEVIVIGAHLDHFGKLGDYIFNGADDNGSGSVGVMELAQAFALNPVKPKRSILFALWTAEERGLLGSRYYVANPYVPMEKTAACLNLDMISRTWDKEDLLKIGRIWGTKIPNETLKKIDVASFLVTSFDQKSQMMLDSLRNCNRYVGMSLYLRKSSGGGGSDHAPFAVKKIPWAFFFGAMTEDYHTPKDSVEKVSFDLIESITRLCYLTGFTLADI